MRATMVSDLSWSLLQLILMRPGSPSVATRNPFEVSLANFTVKAGANHLDRNVAGGRVESGALQRGSTVPTNFTLNTLTGTWNVTGFNTMFITYPPANSS
jgi:alkaline phosphatase D